LAAREAGITPLEYLCALFRDDEQPLPVRLDAAKAAAPFMHPRLTAIEAKVVERRYSDMTPEERGREIERIFKLAREVIDREKVIESEAQRVYVLGSTEAARFSGE
jgi:hypothetical protein